MADGVSSLASRRNGSPSIHSPLTKTCQNCANAKIKCVRSAEDVNGTCNRCQRLGKECTFRQARRRFYGNKTDNRIEQLEANLARVTELLDRHGDPVVATEARLSIPAGPPQRGSTPGSAQYASLSSGEDDRSRQVAPVEYPVGEDVIAQGLLDMDSAERCLATYRNSMIPHFPFVIPPSHLDATRLRQEHPCLFLAIIAVASIENFPLQRILLKRFTALVDHRLHTPTKYGHALIGIKSPEATFDLIQGILIYLAWNQYHSRPRRYTQYLSLAVGLIIDLRLDRPPESSQWRTALVFDFDLFGQRLPVAEAARKDRQRAVIGCYFLASSISILLRKLSPLPFFPQIERFTETLAQSAEHESDRYLPALVRIQRLWEKIDSLQFEGYEATLRDQHSPLRCQIAMLHADLEAAGQSLGQLINSSHLLAMQYYTTRLFLEQICLIERELPGHDNAVAEPWHLFLLRSGLISASALFQRHCHLPPGAEMFASNIEITQVGFALILTPRLVVAASEAQIFAATAPLLQNLDFDSVLEALLARTGALATDNRDEDGARDVFHNFTQRVQAVKQWYTKRPISQWHEHATYAQSVQQYPPPTGRPQQETAQPALLTEAEMDQLMTDWLSYPLGNANFDF